MENNLTKGESFLDRSRCRRPEGKPAELLILLAVVVALFALVLIVNLYTPKPAIAHAATYGEVHSTEAACAYFELYPEKITNVKEYTRNCL